MKPRLFGYDMSPYAEKARVMCGAKEIEWGHVAVPAYEPRPIMQKLTGGYRRIPILQIGSDIYCDTEIIAHALDGVEEQHQICTKSVGDLKGLSEGELERELFPLVVAIVFPNLVGQLKQDEVGVLMADRQKFLVGAKVNLLEQTAEHAREALVPNLGKLNERLGENTYLSGLDHANFFDFGIYHNMRMLAMATNMLDGYEHIKKWFTALQEVGYGKRTEIDVKDAFEDAVDSEPSNTFIGDNTAPPRGVKIGDRVKVVPDDYGVMPTVGVLVSHTNLEIAIRRSDLDAGELHVHFPQHGFIVEPEHVYKLFYYNFRARAEPARLLFAAAGVDYHDIRWPMDGYEQQQAHKKEHPELYPYGQLPVLDADGVIIAQSHTIDRFLARRFGLFGKDVVERGEIDAIVEHCGETVNKFYHMRYNMTGEAQEKQRENYWSQVYPNALGHLERLLSQSNSGFFVGNKLSLADIECYCDVLTSPGHEDWIGFGEVKEKFPNLSELKDNVESHPGVKRWLDVRP